MTEPDPRDSIKHSNDHTELSENFEKSAEVIFYTPDDVGDQPAMMAMDYDAPEE